MSPAAKTLFTVALGLVACSQNSPEAERGGYDQIDPAQAAPVRHAVDAWRDCLVYGIGQVDNAEEPAIAVAEAAMAGCARAETNLEDRLFGAMKKGEDPREVRAMAHDMVRGFHEQMRSTAIRLVLSKHAEERKPAPKK